ncbi:hypothetical protein [Bacillus cereus]|uniref:hypothetical protein n=1 Tax=Bacillus cereus TaxID=1396 RepID=UPI001145A92C
MLHGTVCVCVYIYCYNFSDNNLVKIIDCYSKRKQAIKLYKVDEFLSYEALIYLDGSWDQHITKKESIPMGAIM